MFKTLIFASWKNNLAKHALAVLTMFLASSLISSLLLISLDVGDKMSKELKSYGANILVQPAATTASANLLNQPIDILSAKNYLPQQSIYSVKDIFWRNNILGFAPILGGKIMVNQQPLQIEGTFFAQPLKLADGEELITGQAIISPFWQLTGRYPSETLNNTNQPEIIVGVNLAQKNNWQLGADLLLSNASISLNAKIVGIVTTGAKEDNIILAPLALTQQLLQLPEQIQAIQVSALTIPESEVSKRARIDLDSVDNAEFDNWYCSAYTSSIAFQLEEKIPSSVAKPIWQVAASEGVVIKKLQLLLLIVTLIAFMAAAMGISSLTISNILQRSKQIGLMKALGAENWLISSIFHCESICNALIGGILGSLMGIVLANFISQQLFATNVTIVWIMVPTVICLALLIGWLGTFFASKKLANLLPARTLYGRF